MYAKLQYFPANFERARHRWGMHGLHYSVQFDPVATHQPPPLAHASSLVGVSCSLRRTWAGPAIDDAIDLCTPGRFGVVGRGERQKVVNMAMASNLLSNGALAERENESSKRGRQTAEMKVEVRYSPSKGAGLHARNDGGGSRPVRKRIFTLNVSISAV